MRKLIYALSLIFAFTVYQTSAQQVNPTHIGSVKGILRDTAHNYTLKSATVSLFKGDSTLVNYQLSNNYGEFNFKNLPLNVKMYIEVSHVAYQLYRKEFLLSDAKPLDLKTLIIKPRDITLKEVEIKIPPISMNGDTLEFNAAAFKLDSNAVVEDLLRKIPNVTLWGDGQITVNGREVKSLLVNGKQFFGGDFKMATQNIAKNALDKVQVYATKNEANPLDSTLTVNLKLKKGKDVGHFGKIGGGAGTSEKYEFDGNVNMFSPKMQLGIIAASNNINKVANNINTLTSSSTFKGVGSNIEYQSDFRRPGLNHTNVGGATFNYNFIVKPDWDKKSTLNATYFVQNNNLKNIGDSETTTAFNSNGQILDRNKSKENTISTNQNFTSSFELAKKNHRLNINHSMFANNGQSENEIQRSSINSQNILTNTNNTSTKSDNFNKGLNFTTYYNLSPNYLTQRKNRFGGLNASYNLSINDNERKTSNLTSFRSYLDPTSNRDFDRKYDSQSSQTAQSLDFSLPNLKSLFFGHKRMADFDLSISNKLTLRNDRNIDLIEDLNGANSYTKNSYLSNRRNLNLIEGSPKVTLEKSFYKNLSNRYSKNLNIHISAKQSLIYQEHTSEKSFQNIKRNYSRFTPEASINYNDNQYGDYYRNSSITYTTNIRIPSPEQLAPLTDSANLYHLQKGNLNLREALERTIAINFSHSDQTSKNTLHYSFYIAAGSTENAIVDSIFIDDQNRQTVYLVNANGNKYLNGSGYLRKTIKLKATQLQVGFNAGVNIAKNPSYLNDVFRFSNSLNTNGKLTANFTYKDKLATEITQSINTYRTKQEAFNTKYNGTNMASSLSSSYNITKKITLSSNITFNTSKTNNASQINYTIWNASAVYRFLKGNNAEFKFAALDLLRQNTDIINYGGGNSFTVGRQNVLQQYFLTTLSYYPRKFGKTTTSKK